MPLEIKKTYALTCKKCGHSMTEDKDSFVCPSCGNTIGRQELGLALSEQTALGNMAKSHHLTFRTPNVSMRADPRSTPDHIEIPIKILSLLGITVIGIFYLGVTVLCIYGCLQPEHKDSLVLGLLALFTLLTCAGITRVPYKTILEGDKLVTYSLRGKKSVIMSSSLSVKRVLAIPGRGGGLSCLKVTDTAGNSIFLQLGTIIRQNRELLYTPINNLMGTANWTPNARSLWNKWYGLLGIRTKTL